MSLRSLSVVSIVALAVLSSPLVRRPPPSRDGNDVDFDGGNPPPARRLLRWLRVEPGL